MSPSPERRPRRKSDNQTKEWNGNTYSQWHGGTSCTTREWDFGKIGLKDGEQVSESRELGGDVIEWERKSAPGRPWHGRSCRDMYDATRVSSRKEEMGG